MRCAFVVILPNQPDPLAIPYVGDKWIAFGEPAFEFSWSKNNVVYLAPKRLFGLPCLRCQQFRVWLSHNQKVYVAGGIGFVLCKRAKQPSRLNAIDPLESMLKCRLNANRALEKGKDRLQIGVSGIDAVIKLPPFCF